jgi:hypothetical protein
VWKLDEGGIDVDLHLAGANANKLIAPGATQGTPVPLKVSDLFTAIPYENSLVVLSMNGPQLKEVLERAYRNYYYYKYVPGYGGYSYYTTCMLDIDAPNQIVYNDLSPALPNGNNVVDLIVGGVHVDFADTDRYYNVSTVNYLASGSCNFNDGGTTLWPLDQVVADTQYYVRDAVIDYIQDKITIGPTVDERLKFITDTAAPTITINTPVAGGQYLHSDSLTLSFSATDEPAGVKSVSATLDGATVANGQVIELWALRLGSTHTLVVDAADWAGHDASASATFEVIGTAASTQTVVNELLQEGEIDNGGIANSLLQKLANIEKKLEKGQVSAAISALKAFIKEVSAQSGKHISAEAAALLIADAEWLIQNPG